MKHSFIRITLLMVAVNGLLNYTAFAQNWSLTGNSGTNSSTNFIGTKNNQALVSRTNNSERMRIQGTGNTGIGTNSPVQRLDVNGNINIRTGFALYAENHRVLKVDSVGANIFLGNGAGHQNTGFSNVAAGYNALLSNTSGAANTATGFNSLLSNGTGNSNVAHGLVSLSANTSGSYNSANGVAALANNSTGSNNTASGANALNFNTGGYSNAASGYQALYYNNVGSYNTAIGNAALLSSTGDFNTADGLSALTANNEGGGNTSVGTSANYDNLGAYYNCALGYLALAQAGPNGIPGGYNTDAGSFSGPLAGIGQVTNTVALGEEALTTASNQARIGNGFTTSIGGYTNWSNISDGRVKKNIRENVPGLAFVNKLKPVTYNLDLDAADKIMQVGERKDQYGKTMERSAQEVSDRKAKQQIVYTGFVAQDAELAAKELSYDFNGVDVPKNDHDLYGLRYEEFVVPLVKAVQELSKTNGEKDATIDLLQKQIDDREKRIVLLEATIMGQTPAMDIQQAIPAK